MLFFTRWSRESSRYVYLTCCHVSHEKKRHIQYQNGRFDTTLTQNTSYLYIIPRWHVPNLSCHDSKDLPPPFFVCCSHIKHSPLVKVNWTFTTLYFSKLLQSDAQLQNITQLFGYVPWNQVSGKHNSWLIPGFTFMGSTRVVCNIRVSDNQLWLPEDFNCNLFFEKKPSSSCSLILCLGWSSLLFLGFIYLFKKPKKKTGHVLRVYVRYWNWWIKLLFLHDDCKYSHL